METKGSRRTPRFDGRHFSGLYNSSKVSSSLSPKGMLRRFAAKVIAACCRTSARSNPIGLIREAIVASLLALGAAASSAATVCDQAGVTCIPAQYTPWNYAPAWFAVDGPTGIFDSADAAYNALITYVSHGSLGIYVGATSLSEFRSGYLLPDYRQTATFEVSWYDYQGAPLSSGPAYVQRWRYNACPRGTSYQYYPNGASVCWTNTPTLPSLSVTPTPPTIPSSSGVVQGKVLTQSEMSLYLQNNGAPDPGVQVHLSSSRGIAIDTLSPAAGVTTDAAGKASASVWTRVQPGSSAVRSSDAGINTTTPGVINWLPAKYEDEFLVTCYTIANETDAPASPTSTKVCGLPPKQVYRSAFLVNTKRQGSGKALDGSIIHYNARNSCYNIDTCARTASGACATAGTTIAVDFAVIPRRSSVSVAVIGQRQAQDTGGKIRGDHVDEYLGPQPKLCAQLGRRHSGVTLLNY
jgi:3D (Asp-Asp-Asp) domain-containing protein